jgi:transcriptional regulator with XRE-family HTH domain
MSPTPRRTRANGDGVKPSIVDLANLPELPPYEPVARIIRRELERQQLTLRGFAKRTREVDRDGRGITHSYLAGIARGDELAPSLEVVEMIAAALRVPRATVAEIQCHTLRGQLESRTVGAEAAAANAHRIHLALHVLEQLEAATRAGRKRGPADAGHTLGKRPPRRKPQP